MGLAFGRGVPLDRLGCHGGCIQRLRLRPRWYEYERLHRRWRGGVFAAPLDGLALDGRRKPGRPSIQIQHHPMGPSLRILMKRIICLLILSAAAVQAAESEVDPAVQKLREGLRNVTMQLRDSQNQTAAAQAAQAAAELKIKELEARVDKLTKES